MTHITHCNGEITCLCGYSYRFSNLYITFSHNIFSISSLFLSIDKMSILFSFCPVLQLGEDCQIMLPAMLVGNNLIFEGTVSHMQQFSFHFIHVCKNVSIFWRCKILLLVWPIQCWRENGCKILLLV